MSEEMVGGIIIGFLIGTLIGMAIVIFTGIDSFQISQETADDICVNLTGNSTAIAKSEHGKLICEVPSYDSTQNIIVRGNDGGQNE